jgi:hypothetical protein
MLATRPATRPATPVSCYHNVTQHIWPPLRFRHEFGDWLCAGVLLVVAVLVTMEPFIFL